MRPTRAPRPERIRRRPGLARAATLPPLLMLAVALAGLALAATPHAHASGPQVDVVRFQREVDPAAVQFVGDAIATAERDRAAVLILEIDTPGGDLDSMRQIVQKELASTVPIVSYVTPSGAHAGSAGAFLALAAPVASMAPSTSIGASSPVDASGQNLESTLDRKIKNDLESLMQSLQSAYGRNAAPAVDMVESARSLTETEALDQHVINLVAASRDDLISQLDGYTTASFTLHTAGLPVNVIEPSVVNQFQTVLYNPTIDFVLFIVAALCIYLELAHPGAIVPGTVGAIVFVLFLFGAQALNPNWAGLVLMVVAILLLAVDVRVPTHGVLTVGALISLVAGAFIFFDTGTAPGAPGVPPAIIAAAAVGLGLCSLLVITYALRAARASHAGGVETLVGQSATVLEPLTPEGRVRVMGENWAARAPLADAPVPAGASVRVKAVDGLTLVVEVERP